MSHRPDPRHLSRHSAGAIWLAHSSALVAFAVVVCAVVAAIAVPALLIQGAYPHFSLTAVSDISARGMPTTPGRRRWTEDLASNLAIAVHLFPLIAGVFAGAPLIARELKSNSLGFTSTQEIGRARIELRRLLSSRG